MQFIISVLLSGIAVGGQYALIAIGYTMVYGILRLINFAHGDVFMVAGLMGIYFSATLPLYIALPLVLVMTVVLGFLIERLAYKPLRTAPRMSVMISAIGVSYFLQNTATYITGGQPMVYPEISWLTKTVTIAGTPTKLVVLITPVLVILLVLGLTQLINHTKVGMAMRAVSRDFETAQLMGIKINSVISVTFIIGSALAAHRRCAARPEGVRRRRVRRHRLRPRRRDRRVYHRPVREPHQEHGVYRVLRRVHLRAADRDSGLQAHGPVRREVHG